MLLSDKDYYIVTHRAQAVRSLRTMALSDVRPLRDDLPFGIRIGGLTRAQVDDPAVRDELEALFVRHGMIVFEDVEQSDAMQLAISTIFGPLKEHPVKAVSRVDGDRMPGVIEIR